MTWTVQDEINFCKWVDAKGFRIVFLPKEEQWGYFHESEPQVINGGFERLVDLKQHLVNMKGDNKSVMVVEERHFDKTMAALGEIKKINRRLN